MEVESSLLISDGVCFLFLLVDGPHPSAFLFPDNFPLLLLVALLLSVSITNVSTRWWNIRTNPAHCSKDFPPIPRTSLSCSRLWNKPFLSRHAIISRAFRSFKPAIRLKNKVSNFLMFQISCCLFAFFVVCCCLLLLFVYCLYLLLI